MKTFFQSSIKRRILLVFIGLVIWCSVAIPTTLTYMEYGKDDGLKSTDTTLSTTNIIDSISIDFRVLYTDLVRRSMKVYIDIYPQGAYISDNGFTWNETVKFDFLHKSIVAKKGSNIEPVDFDIPLQTGNLRDYPFDKYTSDILFSAVDNSTKELIPLSIYSQVYKQSINTNLVRDRTGGFQYYIINIKRTNIVYAFCFFISVVTWGLTIIVLNIGFDCMIFKREIPPALLPVGIVMLFAMPALRKTQPDIPDIGCAIDFLCFIWCEILIGIASCMILYSWLLRWKLPINQ
ncbi:hypothetical protein CONCODRAFT_12908 [Conidiobolus coronatus NRRL 28638]|uniref:DUF4436 domain-containing protein n=1 Tax=Conidiobolus coronatus (strain ATCC 28846 / CBS 209.66 / NRRL 28638) TaxID=796925 RepID=A0A137NS16_CONC2|nr:hypothetical protein CONCODRAFT_12908 [Conidiobolus coronatus NRRL 28638]|eukprot:KXN65482.1 hypothetical protein CONCODRAFT_12908 [Conidiobolus coronatus NRRL 28638]